MSSITTKCKKVFSIKNERISSGLMISCWQPSSGGLLATAIEGLPVVYIYNRQGNIIETMGIDGSCIGLSWDADGDLLAVIIEGSGSLLLWEAHSGRLNEIDTGIKDPASCITWSKTGKILAFASSKGNLLIYNHRSLRRVPIIGKHNKKIICAAWSNDCLLALGAADNTLSINTMDGDSVKNVSLRAKPSDMKFGQIKEDRSVSTADNTVSTIVGEKTLYMLKFEEGSVCTPMELGFQSRYGTIVTHHWHGDGYILVCFSAGFIVLVSSHHKEIGTELVLCELKNEPLRHASLCAQSSKLAVCYGESNVQVHEATDPRTVVNTADMSEDDGRIRPALKCCWSEDGQLLAVATAYGDLNIYLTSVPMVGGGNANYVAALGSLTELVLYSYNDPVIATEGSIKLEIEPSVIAVGPYHVAACVNNRAWIYAIQELSESNNTFATTIREFNSNIHEAWLSADYFAVRCADKAYLHLIEGNGMELRDVKNFPENEAKSFKIKCISLTANAFIYGGENGIIKVFHLESWTEISSQSTERNAAIKSIYPNKSGTNCVIIDKNGDGYLFDMPQDKLQNIPSFPNRVDGLLWDVDPFSQHIFITYAKSQTRVNVFVHWKQVLIGVETENIGSFRVFGNVDQVPRLLKKGVVISQTSNGRMIKSSSVYTEKGEGFLGTEEPATKLERLLSLRKLKEAYDLCYSNDQTQLWESLAKSCVYNMDVKTALLAYSHLDDAAMVFSLKRVRDEGDIKIACGHLALFVEEFDLAETFYLESSNRHHALNMRKDLQHWDRALRLATELSPEMVSEICREYGLHYEFNSEFSNALAMFEKSYSSALERKSSREHLSKVLEGLARTNIRCGHLQQGLRLALDSQSLPLKKECAEILESVKSWQDAAMLYEQCCLWEKAASLYIRLKQWSDVARLLEKVNSPKVYVQYAKAKEAEGKFVEAGESYERAMDIENAVRLYLAANVPTNAIRLVKQNGNSSGALQIAKYFDTYGDFDTALRFLVKSRCYEDALIMVLKSGKSDLYAQLILEEFGEIPDEFKDGMRQVAGYFEELKDTFKAGKYSFLAGDYDKAFKLLMRAARTGVSIDDETLVQLLTDTVIGSGDESQARELVEYLLGEKDGIMKDAKYLLNFYIKSNRLVEASKTALIVSQNYHVEGDYESSHKTLVNTCRELKVQNLKIPKDIMDALQTVHYYLLLRFHVSMGNHYRSAHLLLHISENISKFPENAPRILTQAVIECQKAGMKASSLNCAYTLMKPEYRNKMDDKYKNKIEKMVRKSGKNVFEDAPDKQSPCPYCKTKVQNYQLVCTECRSAIPFCIATGQHIVADDLTACPKCEFPAIRSEFIKILELGPEYICPMCDSQVQAKDIVQINDIRPYLNP